MIHLSSSPADPAPPASGGRSVSAGGGVRRRTRDRHGRGVRGPLLAPALPGWRTRADRFDDAVLAGVDRLERLGWGQAIAGVEFAVEDVPPPGTEAVVRLARHDPPDRRAGTPHRIVLHRRPVEDRCEDATDLEEILRALLAEQVGDVLGLPPEEIDPGAAV